MLPVSMEEQVVCFADKFYSKTHLDREKSVEKARDSLLRYGKAGVQRFDYWCKLFCSNLNFFKREIIRINYVLLPVQA